MSFTRLAIATADGVHVCDHLARSTAWVVFEIHNSQILCRTLRTRTSAACGNHATFVDMLSGCNAVICGGIGEGAAVSLSTAGIKPLVAAQPLTIEDAVHAWIAGTLVTTGERVCLCSH